MALLDYEHWNRETTLGLSNWFDLVDNGSVSADNTGPFGYGRYWNGGSGNQVGRRNSFSPVSELWIQAHIYPVTFPAADRVLRLYDGTTEQCGVGFDNLGRIVVTRGTTPTIVHTFSQSFGLAAWYFIQARFLISNTVGECEVWVNGQHVGTATGLNLRNSAASQATGWGARGSIATRVSNLLVYSLAGAAPNARTPETRIYADLANAAGAASAWTRSSGAANYEMVDEQPNDGDTTYNRASAAGLDDLYAYPSSVPGGSIVYAVAVEITARKDDAGTNEIDGLVHSSATHAKGSPVALTTSYQRFRSVWDQDPATSLVWSVSTANGAQVGVRRTT